MGDYRRNSSKYKLNKRYLALIGNLCSNDMQNLALRFFVCLTWINLYKPVYERAGVANNQAAEEVHM